MDLQAHLNTGAEAERDRRIQQGILNKSEVGQIVINDKHLIVSHNTKIVTTTGYSPFELKGMDFNLLLPKDFQETHKKILTEWFKSPKKIKLTERVHKRGFQLKAKDGGLIKVLVSVLDIEDYSNQRSMYPRDEIKKPRIYAVAEIIFIDEFKI